MFGAQPDMFGTLHPPQTGLCAHDFPMGACGYCDAERELGLSPRTLDESAECSYCGELGQDTALDANGDCVDITACGERYKADDGTSATPGEMRRRRMKGEREPEPERPRVTMDDLRKWIAGG